MSQSLTMLSNIDSSLMNQQTAAEDAQNSAGTHSVARGSVTPSSGGVASSSELKNGSVSPSLAQHSTNSDDDDEDDENDKSGLNEDKKYQCDQCHHSFTRKHNLKSHMLIHTDEKPYECTQCNNKFRRQHDLKRHEKLHTGEKPFRCDKCEKRFARADALLRHVNSSSGCSGASTGSTIDPSVSPVPSGLAPSSAPLSPTKRKSYDGQNKLGPSSSSKKSKDATNAEAAAAAAVASAVSNYYVQQAAIQTQQRQSRSRSTQQSPQQPQQQQQQISMNTANSNYLQNSSYHPQSLSNYGGSSGQGLNSGSQDSTIAELYGTIAILEAKVHSLEGRVMELEAKTANSGH